MRPAAKLARAFSFFGTDDPDVARALGSDDLGAPSALAEAFGGVILSTEVGSGMPFASETLIEVPPYEVSGPRGAPTIVVLGGISANRHVCGNGVDPTPGWWEAVAGRGRALDTTRFQIVGCDFIGGGRGSDGRPERIVSTHDQADSIAAVLDEIGIDRVHAVVGASYGGMVALAFAERYPDRLNRLVVIGAGHKPHPMTTALRVVQRRIVELGLETGRERDALALARSLAMTTYRTAAEFGERFDVAPLDISENDAVFPVESYIREHGERFASRWRPERFLALSLSGDLHSVDPAAIRTPCVLVATENDAIAPRAQIDELASELAAPCRVVDLPSLNGHDAFLTEPDALTPILRNALNASILS
jgi:homoserine O-acetyltransferase